MSKPKTSIIHGHAEESYLIVEENFAKGSYGKISLAKEASTGKEVVIKKIDMKVSSKLVLGEVRAGRLLDHENIAKFHQYHLTARNHYLVFDFIK
jgi:serine/threonine protein kinase